LKKKVEIVNDILQEVDDTYQVKPTHRDLLDTFYRTHHGTIFYDDDAKVAIAVIPIVDKIGFEFFEIDGENLIFVDMRAITLTKTTEYLIKHSIDIAKLMSGPGEKQDNDFEKLYG